MPFAATWMDLEIIILSEVKSERERQIPYDVTYMRNLRYNTNEDIYETETDPQIQRQTCGCQGERGMGEGRIGSLRLVAANYYI